MPIAQTGRKLLEGSRSNWRSAVLPAGVTAGAAATAGATTRERGNRRNEMIGAGAGAGIAEAGWRAAGHKIKAEGHKLERTYPRMTMSRSQYNKILRDHRKQYGVKQGDKKTVRESPEFARNYPQSLPAWKHKRALGQMSGRRGLAMEGGLVAGGAMLGARAMRRNNGVQKVDRSDVETAAGGGVAALYGPRLKMVGPAIAAGAKYAEQAGDPRRRDALIALEGRRRQYLTGTDPLVRKLPRELAHFKRTSVLGGLALAAHGHRQKTLQRPERGQTVYGW